MTHPVMFLRLHIRRDVESHFVFAGHHSLCWNMLSCSTSMQVFSQDFQIFPKPSTVQPCLQCSPSLKTFNLCCPL